VKREREVVSFTKDCCGENTKKSAMLFPHSVATKEYTSRFFQPDSAICVLFVVWYKKGFFYV